MRDINLVWKANVPLSPMAAKFRDMLLESADKQAAEHG
jgi:hypothetical protein